MNYVQNAIRSIIPAKHKNAAKGWIAFNGQCCVHNGETPDTRGRAGFQFDPLGAVAYHCFNCNYTTVWKPGQHFHFKIRRLMEWFGMDESLIQRLVLESMRELDLSVIEEERKKSEITFEPRELPENYPISTWLEAGCDDPDFLAVVDYITNERGFSLESFDWRWSLDEGHRRRVLIPYTWKGKEVGYTSRSIDIKKGKQKYIQHVGSDYVFGLDEQKRDSKFALVLEGPFDAIAVDGCAVLTNEISERKAELIDGLAREIIIVPDIDKAGGTMIDAALKYKWSVSFPEWESDVKDSAEAVTRYGKLYTLRSILAGKASSTLKIELLRKRFGI